MKRHFNPNDFVKHSYGWDGLELIFMIQSHSQDFGCGRLNDEIDRKLKDDRIQYCFDICEKLVKDQEYTKSYGDRVYYKASRFYRELSLNDCPDGCLYSTQYPGQLKTYHHLCCGPTAAQTLQTSYFLEDKTRLYKIFLKPYSKVLFLDKAIDTIIKKPYRHRLFNGGYIREPYEIVVLGKDISRVERVK